MTVPPGPTSRANSTDATSSNAPLTASFAMLACAHGAEGVVKESIATQGWRLAFSRPGFVTAKHEGEVAPPSGIFIRTASQSLGSARSENADEIIDRIISAIDPVTQPFDQLHVWPRDRVPIGRFDFEPGVDEVSTAVAEQILHRLGPERLRCAAANQIAEPSQRILDVVLVDPSHWFFGTHTASTLPTRWPGGVQPVAPEYEPISRAYYKAAEAIAWSGCDLRADDLAVEIGSAPGGACGRLLEMGLHVIGVDPAEMDPRIANHPRFIHYAARAGDLPHRVFRDAKWLLVDASVKPDAALSMVGNLVMSRQTSFRACLITMKLREYDRASEIPRWRSEVQRWGAEKIEIRHLARNRCEVCFAVTF